MIHNATSTHPPDRNRIIRVRRSNSAVLIQTWCSWKNSPAITKRAMHASERLKHDIRITEVDHRLQKVYEAWGKDDRVCRECTARWRSREKRAGGTDGNCPGRQVAVAYRGGAVIREFMESRGSSRVMVIVCAKSSGRLSEP